MTRLQRLIALLLVAVLSTPVPLAADEAKNLFNKGRDAEARENYEAAYDFYYKAYDLRPGDIRYRSAMTRTRFLAAASYVHKGQQLRDTGKLDEALVFFEKAAVTDPSNFVAQQEIKKTKEMIDKAKKAPGNGGAASASPDNTLRRRALEAEGPVELTQISPTPITLKLTEDSKVIYQTIGKLAGLNVLFDPDYTSRRISIELNGVTLNEALDIVALESKTFWRPVTANTIFVATDTAAKRKELEQSVVKTFYLSNISQPTELQDMVNAMRTILEVSRIQQLPTQSAIVIRGTPDQVALAEKLVGDIDRAKPEVLIDVVVMQVSRDKVRDLGIQPPASASIQLNSATTSTTSSNTNGQAANTTTGTPNTINLNDFANLHATNFTVTIPGATANFLFSDARTKIIQKPQIRASDGQKASLKIGERVPVATGSFQPGIGGVGINPLVNTQFQYIDVGVNIDITPRLHANREVSMKVMVDISSVTSQANIGGIQQPVIGQRKIEHEIRLKEGEVNLLGGILEDQDIKNLSGFPGLAQIPLLHYLFSESHTEKHQNEIVFALVPHIVRAFDVSDINEKAIDVGTATGIDLRRRPAPPQPAPVPTSQAAPLGAPTTAVAQQPAVTPTVTAPSGAPAMQGTPVQGMPTQSGPAQTIPSQPQIAPAGPAETTPMPAPRPSQPGTVAFSFDPMTINQTVGQTFAVNVVMTGAESIHSVPLQITYDPQMLQLVNVSNGPFLSRDQQPVALVHRDDAVAGILNVNAVRPPDSGGISGDGVVFTLTFQAKAAGHAALAISRPSAKNVYK
ncbi:MAG: type II and III secretion system protein, partial [Acidobacteria bacterium]|nr:type II and III secretion system protein [Acidobacteriota bacterium]